jgi:D-serine dehydratase
MSKVILGHSMEEWIIKYPLIEEMILLKEQFWINSKYATFEIAENDLSIGEDDVKEAEQRLNRFAPFIMRHFPETEGTKGIIESPLVEIPTMKKKLNQLYNIDIHGSLLLKKDSHLAIAGSIKARGGIYEVLKHTEDLALANNLITLDDDYSKLADDKYREFFNQYTVQVGSTGNLGLSIGIMSSKIGYKVIVHMSSDAQKWKKDLLRSKGVEVVEYDSDYSKAVQEGRRLSDGNPKSHFVDDENSKDLFLGYAVAAKRLEQQLNEMKIKVDSQHPLFVYLPCGVGGGPGGVAYGLKLLYKDNVHCFFAEPTHSPCMLLGMYTEKHDKVCVQDFGIDNKTIADGLAVGRASGFVGKTFEKLLSGIFSIDDNRLYEFLSSLADTESIYLEPSACAGFLGPIFINKEEGKEYIQKHNLSEKMHNSTHIVWGTGGNLVPKDVMERYYKNGLDVIKDKCV